MPSLKTLMFMRIASLLTAGAFTVACVGLAGKSLKDLHDNRVFLPMGIQGGIDAKDVLGAMGAMLGAAGLGVICPLGVLYPTLPKTKRAGLSKPPGPPRGAGVQSPRAHVTRCSEIGHFISEFIWWKEERGGFLPFRFRFINEIMLGISCIFLLAASIAAAIICGTKSAKIWLNPPMPQAVVDGMLKATGKSVRYRDQKAFPAMIMGWLAFFFLVISLILTIMAGLHYRRVAAERRSSNGSANHHEKFSEAREDAAHA
ncbi:hypothetical protein A1Q1_05303 [Trichosporon asahii var. asahii CBS 2479]|nr:hypothetical protein A1Q1_05303 [Trichosporon asahii var. asahii CBS 2479]EJT46182.1 hypothetical protein A1Q1_05303 [Trichosporon asahii var. asahii CBS 2479]